MTINKFNYEAFALDFLEGNLSAELSEEMECFLSCHPAIEAELSGMAELVVLKADESITYPDKANLYKKEKIALLNIKWVRPLVAAASIALLLMSYFMGYQAGEQQGELVVVSSSSSSSNINGNNSSEQLIVKEVTKTNREENLMVERKEMEDKPLIELPQNALPKIRTKPMKNLVTQNLSLLQVKTDNPQLATSNQQPATSIPKLLTDNPQLATSNQQLATSIPKPITDNPQLTTQHPLEKIALKIPLIASNNDTISSLKKTLANELPIDKAWLLASQKKKRSFRDLLGRFPINNIKDALIPTYYKEEQAGQ